MKTLPGLVPVSALFFFCFTFLAYGAAPLAKNVVSVSFIDPAKFTDVRDGWSSTESSNDVRRDAVLDELKKFLKEKAQFYLLAGQSMEIKVTDIDLAGDFELWRGVDFDNVRIVKDIYPPRINLEFRLIGADGVVLKEAKRELRDLSYMMTAAFPTSDNLRYEKEMLRSWLSQEFKKPKK